MVELVSALPPRLDQSGVDQKLDVLGNRLARRDHIVLEGEPGAELEQRLVISVGQLVEDRATRRVREGFEDIPHRGKR